MEVNELIEHSNTSKFGDGDGGWHRKGKSGELVRNPVLFLTVIASSSARMAEDRKRKCKLIGIFFVTCLNFRTALDCISTYANPQPELALLARACHRRRRLLLLRVSCSPFAASCRDAPWRSALLPPSARRPSPYCNPKLSYRPLNQPLSWLDSGSWYQYSPCIRLLSRTTFDVNSRRT